jgi:glycosyltransferase involved in cell wall biosynthesis
MNSRRGKIRLALLADNPAGRSGTGRYCRELLAHLLASGEMEGITLFGTRIEGFRDGRIGVVPITSPLPPLSRTYLPFLLFRESSLQKGFDLVHLLSGIPVCFSAAIPSVMTVHDIGVCGGSALHPLWRRLFYRVTFRSTLGRFDRILCDSAATAGDLSSRYPALRPELRIVPLGTGSPFVPESGTGKSARVHSSMSLKTPYILTMGPVDRRKNFPVMLRAFHRVRSEGVQVYLVIAGERGRQYRSIERMIAQLGLGDDVTFTGAVTDEELASLYRNAALLLYPSLWEGFGLPIVEAMACGCPVITSHRGATAETADDAALLVNPDDPGEIARAVASLMQNDALRRRLVFAGAERAARFTWERCAADTLRCYHELLGR